MAKNQDRSEQYVRKVADELMEQIKKGVAPWQKPWKPGEQGMPENLVDRQTLHTRQQPLPDEQGHPSGPQRQPLGNLQADRGPGRPGPQRGTRNEGAVLPGISFLAHPTREYTSVGLQLSPSRQIFSPRYCQRLPAALSESPKPIASASRTSFCRHLSMPGGYRNHFLGCAAGWAIPTEATAHLFAPAC